ncbi:flagellin [Gammaproteobacteria bacterium AS21]
MDINSVGLSANQHSNVSSASSKISSGTAVNSAADSPSAIALIGQFDSQINGNNVAHSNIINGISAIQTAQGGLSSITDSLHQLRELGIQAGNGALNTNDRTAIQNEANELLDGIKDIIQTSQFNNQSLLNNEDSLSLQTGSQQGQTQSIATTNLNEAFTSANLYSASFSAQNISDTLNSIDKALDITEKVTSKYASAQIGLEFSAKNLTNQSLNHSASRSLIEDTDYASAITELYQQQVQEDVEITMLAQANANSSQVLQLLDL